MKAGDSFEVPFDKLQSLKVNYYQMPERVIGGMKMSFRTDAERAVGIVTCITPVQASL